MATRRGGRPPQVRPRPPSSGRAAPVKARPRAPAPGRLATHRKVERGPGVALPFQLLLAAGVLALGVGVLILATGGFGKIVGAIGTTVNGFVNELTATAVPSIAPITAADAPVLEAPEEPYTNQATVDLIGTIPALVAGDTTSRIRIYVAIGDGQPGVVTEVPVGASQHFLVPGVTLSPGTNTFTATIVGPTDLQSEASAAVAYILDKARPKITVSSPKDNAIVNAGTVALVGQTQSRSAMSARNMSTNATVTGAADSKGAFNLLLPIGTGTNQIQITATDPAGNIGTATLAVRRGTGALTAKLTASFYRVRLSKLPERVNLFVTVTDPDGRALAGASVTFTLAPQGIPVIASGLRMTSATGKATFPTTIPRGATAGQCQVTVIVETKDFGTTTSTTVINLTK